MIAFLALAVGALVDFAWVATRARRDWAEGNELRQTTALGISSLYVFAGALIGAALIARPWPVDLPVIVTTVAGSGLIVVGFTLSFVGARPFGSVSRLYGADTGGLIEGGLYRYSRNPQYVGLTISAFAVAVLARSILTLLAVALIGAALWLWVVLVEEPHLARCFGDRYERYRRLVPRCLGLPGRGSH